MTYAAARMDDMCKFKRDWPQGFMNVTQFVREKCELSDFTTCVRFIPTNVICVKTCVDVRWNVHI